MEPLRIGLAGLGTVGAGVLHLLAENGEALALRCGRAVEVRAVSARDRTRDRGIDLSGLEWFDDPVALARSGAIDVFVELIGGEDGAAKAAVEAALASGKPVVTANKALLAKHGTALAKLAEANRAALYFEAAVAGGIPIVKTMRESLTGNQVTRVIGILNGTCNYILTRMQTDGHAFEAVLLDAQRAGYAEADPTFDIEGHDTAHKLAILTSLAFGTEMSFDTIYLEGISSITPADIEAADELGYKIKLLGVALRTESGIEQRVHPTLLPIHSAIAQVDGVLNCVALHGDFAGDIMLVGPGAGARPTASSVVSDIVDLARGAHLPAFGTPAARLLPHVRAAMPTHEGGYYIRLSVHDRPGAFAAIAARMAAEGISLESIVQKHGSSDGGRKQAMVVIVTHETTEAAIRQALDAIEADGHVDEKPQMIRIERL
ncbi:MULTISPECIES: homoserine dehydrogenase [Rhodomicrobium]|uniref:homoserine dehydrogenase n=1 Tax=Rhodomicrobium TaxID=1068 RepID=UPI000B4AD02A|nr:MULTISPECIES: homoserine dehydrogenase [Rhodomicrobium]